MSIWNDLEKYGGYPYYGFPLTIHILDDRLIFHFPRGYTPNGDQVEKVAEEFQRLLGLGTKIRFATNKKKFDFKFDPEKLQDAIYNYIMEEQDEQN